MRPSLRLHGLYSLFFIVGACFGFFGFGVANLQGGKDFDTLIRMGIGVVDIRTLMRPISGSLNLTFLPMVIMANAPQLVFSLLYLAYNGIFTTMSLAREWSGFASSRKGLRCSGGGDIRAGAQRATHFLQLPYRIAIPLLVISGVLHWLISQGIFLVYLESYGPKEPTFNGTEQKRVSYFDDSIAIGWSPFGVLWVIFVIFVMVVLLTFVGLLKFPTPMPVVGSCSIAIAAACHPSAGDQWETEKIWEAELQWGATSEPDREKPGHCSFSAAEVGSPIDGSAYR